MVLQPRQLLVKAEFFVQSLASYPRTARCPHCRSAAGETIARKFKVVRIRRCRECGLAFTQPIYRTWLTDNFYDAMYEAEGSTTALPAPPELEALKASCFAKTDKDAGPALSRIRPLVAAQAPSLLEIGSSWGYFLYQAQQAGFAATGLEIGDRRREFGKLNLGVEIVRGFDELARERRFDVVYSAHVLEHFTDLSTVFPSIVERLVPGGQVFIEVPNIDLARVGPRVLGSIGAIHPLGFDAAFFRRNLPRYGLEIQGIFGAWEDLPQSPVEGSDKGIVIVWAKKR